MLPMLRTLAFTFIILSSSAAAHDLTRLPLGDALKSDSPKRGHIWPCHVDETAGGASVVGPWINVAADTFNKIAKPQVPGNVSWSASFLMRVENGKRIFIGNSLPPHGTGIYPIPENTDAYRYDQNPNSIQNQTLSFSLSAQPVPADNPSCAPEAVGILLSGIPLFSALDAPGRDAVAHEVQDRCEGHPQPSGIYHYHSLTNCMKDERQADGSSKLIGYAIDGFGIFGPYGPGGKEYESKDLDECHGLTSAIMWDDKLILQYHYIATTDFPYTVGCLRGTFDRATVEMLSGPPPGFSFWNLFR
jgi:hypothetical protein